MRVELGIIFQDIFALPFCGDILSARNGQISIRGLFYPLVWKARAWLSTFWKLSGERLRTQHQSAYGLAEYDTLNCAGDTSSPVNFRTSPHAARALSTTGVESDLDATSVLNV